MRYFIYMHRWLHTHLETHMHTHQINLSFPTWDYLLSFGFTCFWIYYCMFHLALGLLNKHSSWFCLLPDLYSTCLNIVLCVYVFNAVFKTKKKHWMLLPYVSKWHMEFWHLYIIVKMCCCSVCIVCSSSLLWVSLKRLCNMQYMQNR